ncbi:Substrate-specific component NikM of nickel ECF transporter [Carbonactinospora thermoautotrophica]|uniref:Substrate-specific component NikM of nickel ECF transporter n=1 Tax=Carbonactinospora thermoautotrophica TaxID=1469144 RepID=A0A132MWG3_9ACTN|nr:PDGLE domain-containing protein [Carbonactinospora thermoautotrophica]KWX02191.1 Substrate-specific component NikM of nickel ECF transporter [Carbonactinospora thermoautotrophica]
MRTRTKAFILAGLLVSLVLAGFVSHFASSDPDGLERVAEDKGFIASAQDHPLGNSPLADYQARGVENPWLSGSLAGVTGVVLTFVVGSGVFWLASRGRRRSAAAE